MRCKHRHGKFKPFVTVALATTYNWVPNYIRARYTFCLCKLSSCCSAWTCTQRPRIGQRCTTKVLCKPFNISNFHCSNACCLKGIAIGMAIWWNGGAYGPDVVGPGTSRVAFRKRSISKSVFIGPVLLGGFCSKGPFALRLS